MSIQWNKIRSYTEKIKYPLFNFFYWYCLATYQNSHSVTASQYKYRNDPKFSDRQAWANSADPDQTAPLFAIPSASFECIPLRKSHLVKYLGWLQQIF